MFSKELVSELSDKLELIWGSLAWFSPETALIIWLLGLIILGLVWEKPTYGNLAFFTLSGLIIVSALVYLQWIEFNAKPESLFLGMLKLSKTAIYLKFLFILCAFFCIILAFFSNFLHEEESPKTEFLAFILSILLGLQILAMAVNLLMIYLSLELISISSYLLTAFYFKPKSAEGSIKYLLFGAFSSGVMLYGMSFLYGFTGSLNLVEADFQNHLVQANDFSVLIAGLLTLAGFLFKISALPFHLWTPDVYEAAPSPIVAFFATAPKIAGIWVLWQFNLRFGVSEYWIGDNKVYWADLLSIVAILSILVGNFAALRQSDFKRMLAYSAIAHAGFLLIPLVAGGEFAQSALFFYLTIYVFMNFGAFLLSDLLAFHQINHKTNIIKYQGLGGFLPLWGILMLWLMLALTGLPPTAGFTAKLLIFSALWEKYQLSNHHLSLILLIVGILNTAVALFYYLKVPFYMFFRGNEIQFSDKPKNYLTGSIWLIIISLPLIVFFIKADWLLKMIQLFL
jgi:NADH-quinone oxidoreductase subunit N